MGPRNLRRVAIALAAVSLAAALAAPLAAEPLGRWAPASPAEEPAVWPMSDGKHLVYPEGHGELTCAPLPEGAPPGMRPQCLGPFARLVAVDLATGERSAFPVGIAPGGAAGRLLANGTLVLARGVLDLRTGALAEPAWPGGLVPDAREGSTLYLVGRGAVWRMDLASQAPPTRIPWDPGEPRERLGLWGAAGGFVLLRSYPPGERGAILEVLDAATGAARPLPLPQGEYLLHEFDRPTAALDATHLYAAAKAGTGGVVLRTFRLPDLAPVAAVPLTSAGIPMHLTAAGGRWALWMLAGGGHLAFGTARGEAQVVPVPGLDDVVLAGGRMALLQEGSLWLVEPGPPTAQVLAGLGVAAAVGSAALAVLAHARRPPRVLLGVPAGACQRCARRDRVLRGFCTACGEVVHPPAR